MITIKDTTKKMLSKESTEKAVKELVEYHLTQFSKEFNLSTEWRESITKNYIEKHLK